MRILAVAANTFRESFRNRVLHALLIVAALVILSSKAVGWTTTAIEEKVIADLGLSAAEMFTALVAIFLGTHLVYQEVERRTIYCIVSRPIGRVEFLVGKYLGLVAVLLCAVAAISAFLYGFILANGGAVSRGLLLASIYLALELAVITAVSLLLSVVASPIEGAIFSFLIYMAGHLTRSLVDLADRLDAPALDALFWAIYVLLPNLEAFNVRREAVHGLDLPVPLGLAALYALAYSAAALGLAGLLFRRKVL